jgi:hypothetical protein
MLPHAVRMVRVIQVFRYSWNVLIPAKGDPRITRNTRKVPLRLAAVINFHRSPAPRSAYVVRESYLCADRRDSPRLSAGVAGAKRSCKFV